MSSLVKIHVEGDAAVQVSLHSKDEGAEPHVQTVHGGAGGSDLSLPLEVGGMIEIVELEAEPAG